MSIPPTMRAIELVDLAGVPGMLAGGAVVSAGKGLMGRAMVGRQVCCGAPENGDGTWAQYMSTPAQLCVPLRGSVSFEQGANLLANPATALGLVDMVRRGKHSAAIQTAAAGDLWRLFSHLCMQSKTPLINIVRRDEQAELLRSLGAKHVLNSTAADFEPELAA